MRNRNTSMLAAVGVVVVIAVILVIGGKNMSKSSQSTENNTPILQVTSLGSWYPASKDKLEAMLQKFWDESRDSATSAISAVESSGTAKVSSTNQEKIMATILPHAGHQYSGLTAMKGIARLSSSINWYKRVLVIGPSHRYSLVNQIIVPSSANYKTPLGTWPIDQKFISTLVNATENKSIFNYNYPPFQVEHSVDNEIPLLQYAFKLKNKLKDQATKEQEEEAVKIVPMIMGQFTDQVSIKRAANILGPLIDEHTLVVISSDFVHYGEGFGYQPFKTDIENNLYQLDHKLAEAMVEVNFEKFYKLQSETGATICGHDPISLLLAVLIQKAREKNIHIQGEIVDYLTSGRLTGDFSHSVSYMSLVFKKSDGKSLKTPEHVEKKEENKRSKGNSMQLSGNEKRDLLKFARKVLERHLAPTTSKYELKDSSFAKELATIKLNPSFQKKCGAFVTLKKYGELRGCIGEILPSRPLLEVINDRAIDAAVNDNRFDPVTFSELSQLEIEISVLTPPTEVKSYKDIIVGQHGILLRKGAYGAVFLPQVATEQGWDLKTTLTHLSIKAGLDPLAWKEGATFQVFQAIVFSEHEEALVPQK